MKRLLVLLVSGLLLASTAFSQGKIGTPVEAEAMVKKAISFYKASGKDKALAEISNQKGKFIDNDLYVFVYDMKGVCVAHGGNPKMIGKELIDMKDADNKAFVQERVAIIKAKGKGWQNYKWSNPVSKRIENKTAYIEKFDDLIFGCGAYKK
ncbi:MAG: cache domain-containing protein [Ignavibacteria bacterium]